MTPSKKIYLGSDHAGFKAKSQLVEKLKKEFPDLEFEDLGNHSEESADYPVFAKMVAKKVAEQKARGILMCGSGIGMSIAANKVAGVRAFVSWDVTSARLSRQHNDTNVLCMGARLLGAEVLMDIARTWLVTDFAGGRHAGRVNQIE